jgi:hypothetical protein
MSQARDVTMAKRHDAMPNRNRLSMLPNFLGMLQGLPRLLVSREVILLPLQFGYIVGMRRLVM